MDNNLQRLRELDQHRFEELCFQLIQARFPQLRISRVDGSSGDDGIDIFSGDLETDCTVWQVKFFTHRIGKSQRAQIRGSLKRVLHTTRPARWVLCLPINLDTSTHRWLQRLGKSYGAKTEINVYAASDIARDLIHYRSVRDHFFPDIPSNTDLLRAVLKQARGLTDGEAEAFTEENILLSLKELQDKEPRLGFQVVFSRDVNPDVRPVGAIGSLSVGNRTVYLFPRDLEALQADPLRMGLAFTSAAREKFEQMRRFGDAQTFTQDEVTVVRNPLPKLLPQLGKADQFEIRFGRRRIGRILRAKCEAIGKDDRVTFDYLEFNDEKVGDEELVLVSRDTGLGFVIRLVVRKSSGGTITFQYSLPGTLASDALKLFRTLLIVRGGGQFWLTDLESGKRITGELTQSQNETRWETEVVGFLEKVDRVSKYLGIKLRLPVSQLEETDLETITNLDHLCSGGTVSINQVSANLVKSKENRSLIVDYARKGQELSLVFQLKDYHPAPVIFGQTLNIGWVEISGERLVIKNGLETARLFESASEGTAVPLEFEIRGSATLRLIKAPSSPTQRAADIAI